MHKHTQVEEWRDIPGYEGQYQASNHGQVRSVDRIVSYKNGRKQKLKGRVLKPATSTTGHIKVNLGLNNPAKLVHRLVLETFIGTAPEGFECCHNDGNPGNNYLSNLRWDTRSSNNQDRIRHGTHNNSSKTHCPRGHKLESLNLVPSVLKRGGRNCLACSRALAHAKRHNITSTAELQKISDEKYDIIMAA